MPPEQRLADYLCGTLTDEERAALEAELAIDPEGLGEVVRQRRLEAALGTLLNPNTARLEAAILASVRGASDEAIEARVLEATVLPQPTQKRRTMWEAATIPESRLGARAPRDDSSKAISAQRFGEHRDPISPLALCLPRLRAGFGGSWKALCGWFRVKPGWGWAGVAVAVVLVGLGAMSFWSANRSGQGGSAAPEWTGTDRESELLRELTPLVTAPPVWTGSEQQTAWLTALAAVTAPGEPER